MIDCPHRTFARGQGCTPYDCPTYGQTKFATPILYAIDNFENYDIFFYIEIAIQNIFCIFFVIFGHLHFCSNCFSSLLRHSSQKQYFLWIFFIIKFSYHFLLCNSYGVYLLMKKHLINFDLF